MTAEIALQRDDCGRAAANYTIAAQRLSDVNWRHAPPRSHWIAASSRRPSARRPLRSLVPTEPLRCMLDAGGAWSLQDRWARGAFEEWVKNGGLANARVAGTRIPARPALPKPCDCWRRKPACPQRSPCCAACRRGRCKAALAARAGGSRIRWLELPRALQYAQKALSAGAAAAPAQMLLARAHAGLARRPGSRWPRRGTQRGTQRTGFASADVLMLLGREREARTALETLRDVPAST